MKYLILALVFIPICSHADKILIVGDSISLGYTPYVQEKIHGVQHNGTCPYFADNTAPVTGTNGGSSKREAACIRHWLRQGHFSIVHFNAGMHDVHVANCANGGNQHQVELSDYLRNLQTILDAIRKYGATPIFATTTPVHGTVNCHSNSDIIRYNAAAISMMQSQGVQIDDLYSHIVSVQDKYHHGIHFDKSGYQILANKVSNSIK